VTFPVFSDFEVRVIFARDVAATARRLGEREDMSSTEAAIIYFLARPTVCWLVLPRAPGEGVVAHEAAHVIRRIFDVMGVKDDDEAFAYHLCYLVERIYKFLRRKKHGLR
jgi:hypothetical protein